jgi:phage-related protein
MGFFGSVFGSLKSAVSTVYSDAKSAVSTVYHSIDNHISQAETIVGTVPKTVDDVATKVVSGVSGVANNVVNKTSSTIGGLGFDLTLPLLLIGGGALLFLSNQNGNTLSNVSKNVSNVAPLAF